MNKIYNDANSATKDLLKGGMIVAAGGFGHCGIPEHLIVALRNSGVKSLTVVSNDTGVDNFGLGIILGNSSLVSLVDAFCGFMIKRLIILAQRDITLFSLMNRNTIPLNFTEELEFGHNQYDFFYS